MVQVGTPSRAVRVKFLGALRAHNPKARSHEKSFAPVPDRWLAEGARPRPPDRASRSSRPLRNDQESDGLTSRWGEEDASIR